ncbi:MAG: ribonucleoside-diphosphate reductase subunit alpha [Candidatus Pacebacteria bacterium]|nr:ribonucleoside-diphosphate reductase subunit alpha [Candidatus Paceibacterota bacterium]
MHPILREIRKRRGQVVPFEQEKIVHAVSKAFEGATGDKHEKDSDIVMDIVVADLVARAGTMGETYVPSVEEVQDLVERALMQRGFFDVAKSYIVYRYEHQKIREEKQDEVQEKIEKREFFVTTPSGTRITISRDFVRGIFSASARDLAADINLDELVMQSEREMYEGMSMRDVAHTVALVARSFIERDPAYATLASRLSLELSIYPDCMDITTPGVKGFEDAYRAGFKQSIARAVELELLDPRMMGFNLDVLATNLDPNRDNLLKYLGTETLSDRYLIRDKTNRKRHIFLEAPQMMWMRIAMGLALTEQNKEERAVEFYNLLSTLRYVPSTPTLFHAGGVRSQLSSCFLGVVDDDLHSIFKSYEDYANMARYDGGIAYAWTKLRATGALIKSTHIDSNGVVPFLKILDSTVVGINRSGRRRGACAVYLEPWHADVEEFIELRKNTGDERRRTPELNTALWIPDVFMQRVRDDGMWTLLSPDEAKDLTELYGSAFTKRYEEYEEKAAKGELRIGRQMRARDLWKKVLTQLFETGHPWITFKDSSNIRSPQDHVGVVHNSNLCTEITLNNSADDEVAVCNLGSINLATHIRNGKLDEAMIKETTTAAMRMLDNVIDLNYYSIKETKKSNMRHRPVGLGIMGFQDALFLQNINFESEECVEFADASMEMISYYSILASSELAAERGAYETYKGSKWDRGIFPVDTLKMLGDDRGDVIPVSLTGKLDWSVVRASVAKHGMRNSNCMAMAPTATIANIAGCFPTIEPIYKNIYVKANIAGDFIIVNTYLVDDLKKEGLWNSEMIEMIKGADGDLTRISSIPTWIKEKHKEVFMIDPAHLVKVTAYRAKWIDQSQSFNIFFSGTSGAKLSDVYQLAWQMGVKTTYYLRTLAASGIEKSTVTLDKQQLESTIKERNVAQEAVDSIKAELAASDPVPVTASVAPAQGALKLCKIDDPTCESCQ